MSSFANARIAAGDSTCQLTYDLSTDPAPVTASVPTSDPSLATLTFIVTNDTGGDLDLGSVVFSIPVGPDAASLSPGSAGIGGSSLDTRWQVNGPSTPVSQGLAAFTLAPKSGATLPVPNGSALVVIFEVPVNQLTGTATIDIAEHIDPAPGFTSYEITKYPPGFFFDGLTVNVGSGSSLQPVAQVARGTAVTLSWNVSVVPLSAIDIYYSSNAGQQPPSPPPQINPTSLSSWTSPTLVNDTLFTIVVTAHTAGGDTVTAALSAAVRVQQPDIAIHHIDAQSLSVTGGTSLNGATTATAALVAQAGATVSGGLLSDTITTSGTATIGGPLTASTSVSTPALAAGSLAVGGGKINASANGLSLGGSALNAGPISCDSVDTLRCWVAWPWGGVPFQVIAASTVKPVAWLENPCFGPNPLANTGINCVVWGSLATGIQTNGRIVSSSASMMFSHVPTRAGHRVITAPAVFEEELHLSGEGRLDGGRAAVRFDDEIADALHHCANHPYRVQLTPTGLCGGLAVTAKAAEGFTVEELGGSQSDAAFDWFVVARRPEEPAGPPRVMPERLPEPQRPTDAYPDRDAAPPAHRGEADAP